jgi:hypothetical protein
VPTIEDQQATQILLEWHVRPTWPGKHDEERKRMGTEQAEAPILHAESSGDTEDYFLTVD